MRLTSIALLVAPLAAAPLISSTRILRWIGFSEDDDNAQRFVPMRWYRNAIGRRVDRPQLAGLVGLRKELHLYALTPKTLFLEQKLNR